MIKIPGFKYSGLIIGIIFLLILLSHERLSNYDEGRYVSPPPSEIALKNTIKFRNATSEYNLDGVEHRFFFPNPDPKVQRFKELITIEPSLATFDLNNDGYMDLYYNVPQQDLPSRVFINDKGTRFIEITDKMPFLKEKGQYGDNIRLWFDFNHDGLLDVYAARSGCHAVYIQDKNGDFKALPDAVDYCSIPKAANVADINQDGHLDIILGNFFHVDGLHELKHSFQSILANAGLAGKGQGGLNAILLGDGTGHFTEQKIEAFEKEGGQFTQGIGISYINSDTSPDIFVGNDYYYDEMYMNMGDEFVRVTDQFIPRVHHGWSSMNTEFVDVDMDGLIDLYVTNGWGPPSFRGMNLLWHKKSDGSGFEQKSRDMNIHKCAWGWGAKFSDYDLDGDLDLFVSNGRATGTEAKSFDESKSWNFLRSQVRVMPNFLRQKVVEQNNNIIPTFDGSDYHLFGFERNCLFLNENGTFHDVAESAGIDDLENGNSMIKVDLDNNGRQDIIIGNANADLILYKNITDTDGNWIGFNAINHDGQPYVGSIVRTIRSDNKPLVAEIFPMNGYRGQNDPRVSKNTCNNHSIFRTLLA